ncbi:GDYXXLXY domain-containing protein [bacterium]|nr:GDYXXLXY domain-containing protein [bacterium]
MKTAMLYTIAALELLVLAYMAGEREWVVRFGRTVYLRTAPVDPRDVMRGDYVRLAYDITRVSTGQCSATLAALLSSSNGAPEDAKVYAVLRTNEDDLAELDILTDERPAGGLYLRGRLERSWALGANVRYGLGAYFMEQGAALALEEARVRDGVMAPLEMAVGVGARGLAVIKGHRWCALGAKLVIQETNVVLQSGDTASRSTRAEVLLVNTSTGPVAVVDMPGGRSLALLPDARWDWGRWRWSGEGRAVPAPQARDVFVLQTGEWRSIHVEFADPYWNLLPLTNGDAGMSAVPLRDLLDTSSPSFEWSDRFRFEYRPPGAESCAGLPGAGLIWHGTLPTRAFSATGFD